MGALAFLIKLGLILAAIYAVYNTGWNDCYDELHKEDDDESNRLS